MTANSVSYSQAMPLFKGIALFTPGGDLIYCIDPHKQARWHLQLCAVLQEMLGLSEPPHFLVPCYTATIDRWLDPRTQKIQTYAEACPLVSRYQPLLNVLFGLEDVVWSATSCPEEICDLAVLSTYRKQFPQLWENHNLVMRYERVQAKSPTHSGVQTLSWSLSKPSQQPQGYVLRLFISGSTAPTERILENLHYLLEQSLQQPYTLKVIDTRKHPDLAELDQVAATPTLVKAWPPPIRKIVGNLEDAAKVLQALITSDTRSSNLL